MNFLTWSSRLRHRVSTRTCETFSYEVGVRRLVFWENIKAIEKPFWGADAARIVLLQARKCQINSLSSCGDIYSQFSSFSFL